MSNVGRYVVIHRSWVPRSDEHRNGVLCGVDRMLLRSGQMRETIIISAILILAVWLWIPRKGGKE